MTGKVIGIFLVSFLIAVLSGPIYIPFLKKLKFGQTVRDDGPQTHLKKTGTPTIGGLIFLTPAVIVGLVLFFIGWAPKILPVLLVTVGFGFVGFFDDYLKIIKKSKDGLLWYQKMGALLVISVAFSLYEYFFNKDAATIILEFFGKELSLNLSWFFVPFAIFVLLASTNSVNLTDGLDGLCAGNAFIVFLFFFAVSMLIEPNDSVALFSVMMAGSVLGFLIFNYHPAKVFMGDTGSLALGGALGACAIVLNRPFLIVGAGLLFVLEAVSVLLQVSYFKLTKGKRLFRMAPLHHHFELKGWKELKVTYVFWTFTLVCCIITYLIIR
ncbi:MAG: phospho-N-acetylmuramoyl-pentapeptide-transferase [Clostridia bacterium]|nr:phospho-N-acetylmuramoyl-pentapeptide-transferase [Clostridia bacterium]